MIKRLITFPLLLASCSLLLAQASWVATDALGRSLPTAEECPLKTDKPRTVGIFYITWHTQGLHDGQPYTRDVSKLIEADPMCTRGNPDWPYATYHWGEPEYGYFLSQDKYVCFHDLSMLADAGVDVLHASCAVGLTGNSSSGTVSAEH